MNDEFKKILNSVCHEKLFNIEYYENNIFYIKAVPYIVYKSNVCYDKNLNIYTIKHYNKIMSPHSHSMCMYSN